MMVVPAFLRFQQEEEKSPTCPWNLPGNGAARLLVRQLRDGSAPGPQPNKKHLLGAQGSTWTFGHCDDAGVAKPSPVVYSPALPPILPFLCSVERFIRGTVPFYTRRDTRRPGGRRGTQVPGPSVAAGTRLRNGPEPLPRTATCPPMCILRLFPRKRAPCLPVRPWLPEGSRRAPAILAAQRGRGTEFGPGATSESAWATSKEGECPLPLLFSALECRCDGLSSGSHMGCEVDAFAEPGRAAREEEPGSPMTSRSALQPWRPGTPTSGLLLRDRKIASTF